MFPAWSLCLPLLFASASIPDGLSGIQAFWPKSSAHTQSALEFWCCFKMRSWAPSPLRYWMHYYTVCLLFYCRLSGQYCSCRDDLWHVSPPVLTLQSRGTCKVRCVLLSDKNDLSPANNVQYSWHDGKLMNVFTSYIHTYTTQGLCKHCGTFAVSMAETLKTVYQSLLAQLGRERETEDCDGRKEELWKRDTAVSSKRGFRCSMLDYVRVFWIQSIYEHVYASLSSSVQVCCYLSCHELRP